MTTIPRDGHRVVTIELRVRVCACVEQQPHRFDVPFTRGEVDRLVIPGQVRIALEQAT